MSLEENMPKGFGNTTNIVWKRFAVELKHRPEGDTTGGQEVLIDTLNLYVPKLKNAEMEKQWAFVEMWGKLESEYKGRGINQIFIFTAEFGQLIARMESNEFADETACKLNAPTSQRYKEWEKKIDKQLKRLYGTGIDFFTQTDDNKHILKGIK